MKRFDGRVALVTGAGRGIGAAVVERLAGEGAKVMAVDIDEANVRSVASKLGANVTASVCDIGDELAVNGLFSQLDAQLGRLDVLINVAGLIPHLSWDEIDYAEWRRVMRVNLDGTFLICRAASLRMRANAYGRIVNIGSSSVFLGSPSMSHYIASKGGVMALTRALATELGGYGITANCLAPGLTETEGVLASKHREAFSQIEAMQALHGRGVPGKIVPAITFLASEEAGWITGQTLVADGGVVRW
jgi:NAD(P)-dependent dehydrogenase (short-subunit alcohol dehydrogenase family)